jgi:hypothetical protein
VIGHLDLRQAFPIGDEIIRYDIIQVQYIGRQCVNVIRRKCMRRRHWHGAVNIIEQGRRERPVAADGRLGPIVLQRAVAACELGESSFAFAERAVTGGALVREDGFTLADGAFAGW